MVLRATGEAGSPSALSSCSAAESGAFGAVRCRRGTGPLASPSAGYAGFEPVSQTQVKIQPENHLMVALLGQRDEFLRLIEQHFDAKPFVRGNEITIEGPEAAQVG